MSTSKDKYKVIGTRPIRHDGVEKVTGTALYGSDLILNGMLFGKILRSPFAHARIKSIDVSKASSHPEVKAIATFDDLADMGPLIQGVAGARSDNVLAKDKVLYRGHAIAAVAALTSHAAEEALSMIDVEYEVLPSVMTVEQSLLPDAPVLHDHWDAKKFGRDGSNIFAYEQHIQGDVDKGFSLADRIFEREYRTKTVHQGYIEPQSAIAYWAPAGRLTIWCSSQGHFGIRDATASVLGIPVSQIKVIPMEIGGGFGGKLAVYLEPVASVLSKKSRRPVKMTMNRSEVFESTGPTSGSHVQVKIGVTDSGKITSAKATYDFEGGGFGGAPISASAGAIFASYNIANVQIDTYDVVTNKPRTTAYRAPGAPIVTYAVESLIDEIAEELDIDPMDLRLINVARKGDRRPDGVMNGSIGAEQVMNAVKEHPHYTAPLLEKNHGRGVSMGFCRNNTGMSSAIANVMDDGTVSLIQGSVDIGGSRTAIAQQFAETLGIPVEDVVPSVGDTDAIGYTANTAGSSVAFKTGWVAVESANDIKRQMIDRASLLWGVPVEEIEYLDGVVQHKTDSELRSTFKDIAASASETGGPIVGRSSMNVKGSLGSYSANIVDVSVDIETGKVEILRYTAFQDTGTTIHPSYVEGQIQGGSVQGIGWALNEEYYMSDDGQMLNPNFLDYRMPITLDLPMIDTVLVEVPNPNHPFGVKGVGEASISPPIAAIANAIYDAAGVRMRSLPMNPSNVFKAISS